MPELEKLVPILIVTVAAAIAVAIFIAAHLVGKAKRARDAERSGHDDARAAGPDAHNLRSSMRYSTSRQVLEDLEPGSLISICGKRNNRRRIRPKIRTFVGLEYRRGVAVMVLRAPGQRGTFTRPTTDFICVERPARRPSRSGFAVATSITPPGGWTVYPESWTRDQIEAHKAAHPDAPAEAPGHPTSDDPGAGTPIVTIAEDPEDLANRRSAPLSSAMYYGIDREELAAVPSSVRLKGPGAVLEWLDVHSPGTDRARGIGDRR